jgi:hypothetical protein
MCVKGAGCECAGWRSCSRPRGKVGRGTMVLYLLMIWCRIVEGSVEEEI